MESNEEHENDHVEMLRLLRENNELLKKNTEIVKTLHRWSIFGMIARILWYALLIGFPVALYYYVFEPYFTSVGANYDVFQHGIGELPGIKAAQHFLQLLLEKK